MFTRSVAYLLGSMISLMLCPAQTPPTLAQLNDQGRALIRTGDLVAAETLYRSATEQARAAGDKNWEAEFLRATGETLERRSQFAAARPLYEAALALRLRMDDKSKIALLEGGIGLMCLYLRDDGAAEKHLTQAVALYEQLKETRGLARALEFLSQLRLRQSRLAEAEQTATRAIALYDSLNDKAAAARVRASLAEIDIQRMEPRKALESAFLALDADREMRNNTETARVYSILGNIFMRLQQPSKALTYYQESVALREKLKAPLDTAAAYSNRGAALDRLGRSEEALDSLRKALVIRRELGAPAEVAGTLVNLGRVQQTLGQPADARASFTEALSICQAHDYASDEVLALYSLGNLAMDEKNYDQAQQFHQRALDKRRSIHDRLGEVYSLNRLALVSEARNDFRAAEKLHREAFDKFQPLMNEMADPAQIASFRAATPILYPHYARTLVKNGKVREAFLLSEQGRGAALAQMANLSNTSFADLLTDSEKEAWNTTTATLSRASNHLRVVAAPGAPDKTSRELEEARAGFDEAERQVTTLRDRFFAQNPRLQAALRAAPPSIDDYLKLAKRHPDTLFLQWMMVGNDQALLFSLSAADGLQCDELPAGRKRFSELEKRWRGMLEASRASRGASVVKSGASPAEELAAAQALFTAAMGPAAPRLARGKWSRLVVVADGALQRVPFVALADAAGARLLDRYTITNAISLRSWISPPQRPSPQRTLFAIGDPLKPGEERTQGSAGQVYPPLQFAAEEAQSVAALFPQSVVEMGPSAREALVKQALPQYAILHFATHGILDPADGMNSGLLLATEDESSSQDGFLQAWEIAALPLTARLAVLSACQTGEGDDTLGEGLIGLAWAFQGAGCPNVIASLWNVDDAGTKDTMLAFYQHLRAGKPMESALRLAMQECRAKAGYASPYYWAAFQLIGSGGTVNVQ